jgi:hypothetical protein
MVSELLEGKGQSETEDAQQNHIEGSSTPHNWQFEPEGSLL